MNNKKTKYYPVGERIPHEDLKKLGLNPSEVCRGSFGLFAPKPNARRIAAKTTGDRRPPKAGEWYLSGAIPAAYRAPNDLTTAYQLATLAVVETILTTAEVEVSS